MPVTLVLRFEHDANGNFISLVDSPDQGAKDIGVSSVSQEGSQLKLVVSIGAEFSGEVKGNEIVGTWTQGGGANPLTVTKD